MRHAPAPVALLSVALIASAAAAQDDWPQWRGPKQDGISHAAGNLPTSWSGEENIVWKTKLPSWSGATPIIWGDTIFVTSPTAPTAEETAAQDEQPRRQRGRRGRRGGGSGAGPKGPGGQTLLLIALSKTDGSIRWQRELDTGNVMHRKGNDASPSPVTDGRHVWTVTGNGTVTAHDFDGELVWKHDLQETYGDFGLNWGYASSPLLHDGKLYVEVLHGTRTDDDSYIIAFDAASGDVAWRTVRATDAPFESPDAYTTPIVLRHGGQTHIVVSGADCVTGHDPDSGAELWRVNGLNPSAAGNYRIVASPLAVDGMIYAPTRVRPLLAIAAGDDVRPNDGSVVWTWNETGSPDVPTPVCDGTFFYMVNDRGMVTCLDAKTGKAHWGPTRTVSGSVSASPLLADGKLYVTNEEAITVVLAAGPEFKMLAENPLDGTYTLSSPVAVGSQLFIRTSTHLYCIGSSGAVTAGGTE